MRHPTRRAVLGMALAPAGLAGCGVLPELPGFGTPAGSASRQGQGPIETPDYAKVYGPLPREKFKVAALDVSVIDPAFLRADIPYVGPEPPGTVVVDPRRHILYLVTSPGRARRYGVAVGPLAKGFSGAGTVAEKRLWPDWPAAGAGATGGAIPGGPRSPAGARGLFLAANGRATDYVIHGTPNPETVGTDVKTGCIALINQDIIDLHDQVQVGTRVIVLA